MNNIKKTVAIITLFALILSVAIVFSGCSKSETALKIDGFDVSYDMVRYFVMNYKASYTEDELKDDKILSQIEENTVNSLKELYTYKSLAKENGVKLSKEEKDSVDEQIKALKESYDNKEEYKKGLADNYMTEAVYREILETEAICDLLYDKLTYNAIDQRFKSDNATTDADLKTDKWYSAEYIYLCYSETNRDERKAVANSIKESLDSGVSMGSCYNAKAKDYEYIDPTSGSLANDLIYASDGCFTDSIYNKTFEDTLKNLEIGEISDVIDYSGGSWLIIKRLEISNDYVDNNYNNIIAQYLSREFFNYVSECSQKLSVEKVGQYKDMCLGEIE